MARLQTSGPSFLQAAVVGPQIVCNDGVFVRVRERYGMVYTRISAEHGRSFSLASVK